MKFFFSTLLFLLRSVLHALGGSGPCCRFTPTCSQYAAQCWEQHGLWMGTIFVAKRLASCRPRGGFGWDPVPEVKRERNG